MVALVSCGSTPDVLGLLNLEGVEARCLLLEHTRVELSQLFRFLTEAPLWMADGCLVL
jgi:hypothetical protein